MKIDLLFLIAFISAIAFKINAQCPNTVDVSAADKCFEMSWTTPPNPLPTPMTYIGNPYSYFSGNGTTASPAIYKDVTNPNCGNFSLFSGSIVIGGYTCTYTNGVHTNQTMPLILLDFKYSMDDNILYFTWSTLDEKGIRDFTLERAGNSFIWTEIGIIDAIGNSANTNIYEMYDDNPMSMKNYYRLKTEDLDGEVYYSPVLSYDNRSSKIKLSVYPNPANDVLNINYDDNFKPGYVQIIDMRGNRVINISNQVTKIDISGLKAGIYILKAGFSNGEMITQKILKK